GKARDRPHAVESLAYERDVGLGRRGMGLRGLHGGSLRFVMNWNLFVAPATSMVRNRIVLRVFGLYRWYSGRADEVNAYPPNSCRCGCALRASVATARNRLVPAR